MASTGSKQLCFDFMETTPKQLSPRVEYAAYLRSIRDETIPPNAKGVSHATTQPKGRKVVSAHRKVQRAGR
jgi:hypothetical protein